MKKNSTAKQKPLHAVETWDLADEQKQCEQAAQYLIDILETVPKMPDFITCAVIDALIKAARLKSINIWREAANGGEELDPRGLADLITVTQGSFSLRQSAQAELAGHVSAILKHRNTPAALYNALACAVCDLSNNIDDDTPEYVEYVLSYNLKKEGDKGAAS